MASIENLVGPVLVSELWGIALAGLKLDGDRLTVQQVGSFEDDTKRPFALCASQDDEWGIHILSGRNPLREGLTCQNQKSKPLTIFFPTR